MRRRQNVRRLIYRRRRCNVRPNNGLGTDVPVESTTEEAEVDGRFSRHHGAIEEPSIDRVSYSELDTRFNIVFREAALAEKVRKIHVNCNRKRYEREDDRRLVAFFATETVNVGGLCDNSERFDSSSGRCITESRAYVCILRSPDRRREASTGNLPLP